MNNIFAERLKKAMEQKNMKQIDLVKKAAEQGVKLGKSHVSQYLSGKTTPRSEILNFLATTLGVETEWLKGTDVSVDTLKKETNEAGIQMENMKFDYNYNNMKENTRETVEEVQVREFKKSSKLNNVLYDVRGPVVEEAARMENAGTQVLKLNIGNPAPFGFRTPDEVIYDMRQQLTECEGYSPAKGLFSARKAIMQYAQLKKLPNVSIEDIYTGNGVSELINLCMSALLDNGDEILIPSPDYPLWTACATLAGGKAVHYICDEQAEWYPDMDDIRKKITSRTKAIVIINPNNPTGALYPREVLQQIVDIAREHHLIIFSDEIYDRLVMDGAEHISIASMAPDLFCVTFSGLSKSHMIALMKMIVEGIMGGKLPWTLVFIGVFLAIGLEILRIPVMPFAIGLYLPIYLNAAIMIGGVVRMFVDGRKNVDDKKKEEQATDGTLYCAGMIAGEGLVGILLAILAVVNVSSVFDLSGSINLGNAGGVILMLLMILSLLKFSIWNKKKA